MSLRIAGTPKARSCDSHDAVQQMILCCINRERRLNGYSDLSTMGTCNEI
jgi:hypothetical protein